MAHHLGLDKLIDPWNPNAAITPGALHVTNTLPPKAPRGVLMVYSLPDHWSVWGRYAEGRTPLSMGTLKGIE